MNDIAAGIGLEQLKKLDGFVKRRIEIYSMYDDALYSTSLGLPPKPVVPTYFFWVQTPQRDELARFLRANLIYSTFRYWPLHYVFRTGDSLPGAEWAANNTLLLPLHQGLTDDQVQFICETVIKFYKG